MKRTAFNDEDIPLPPHGAAPVAVPVERFFPCTRCGVATPYDTMSALGARCRGCYVAYCREPQPYRDVPAEAVPAGAGNRAWAYKLRWREQQGDRLTEAQRSLWRAAIKHHPIAGFEA